MEKQSKIEALEKAVNQAFDLIQEIQKEQFEKEWNKLVEKQKQKEEIAVLSGDKKESYSIIAPDGKKEKISPPLCFSNISDSSEIHTRNFKEYADMWKNTNSTFHFWVDWEKIFVGYKERLIEVNKENKLNRLNERLEDLDLEREDLLRAIELTKKDIV